MSEQKAQEAKVTGQGTVLTAAEKARMAEEAKRQEAKDNGGNA